MPGTNATPPASPAPPLAIRAELEHQTLAALGPITTAIAVVFGVFIPFNLLDLPPHAVSAVVASDVLVVALATVLRFVLSRRRLPASWAAPVTVGLAWMVAGNILLTMSLLRDPFFTAYVAILIIAVGIFVLPPAWAALGAAGMLLAWIAVAAPFTAPHAFTHWAFIVFSAAAVAVATHVLRRRIHVQMVTLRAQDAARQATLEEALATTEQARADLDCRVEERTGELRAANLELTREIEERRRMEHERQEMENRLQHAQKMESIGRLAGGVAHDFNNLLTIIDGQIQMARRRAPEDPRLLGALDEAAQAATRAAEVTRQLLAFSRRQIMQPRTMNPNLSIQGIHKMMERAAGERIRLVLDVDRPVRNINADPGQLEQVVMNLVINAADAMPTGGAITLRLDELAVSEDALRAHPGCAPGDYVRLLVADTGTGIDASTLQSIFEPFFTTKEVGKGTGLGLSMVHGIITQHGGFIEVRSAEGEGTTFEVCLPVSTNGARVTAATAPTAEATRGQETVLVVEDAAAVRRLAVSLLRGLGYHVLEAEDGEAALRVASAHAGPLHLLLTDVIMPGLDGPGLAERLTAERPGLRVLFASGYSDDRLAPHGVLGPGVHFIPKPYRIDALSRAVREALQGPTESGG